MKFVLQKHEWADILCQEIARKNGFEGSVSYQMTIDEKGEATITINKNPAKGEGR